MPAVAPMITKLDRDIREELVRLDGEIAEREDQRSRLGAALHALVGPTASVQVRAAVTQLAPRRARRAAKGTGERRPTASGTGERPQTRWQQVRGVMVVLRGTASVAAIAGRLELPTNNVAAILTDAKNRGLVRNNRRERTWSLLPGKPVEIPSHVPNDADATPASVAA